MRTGMMMLEKATRFFAVLGLLGSLPACKGSDDGHSVGPVAKVFINELQPSNQDTVTDDHGDANDWIEIYNADTSGVDLDGFVLSDSGTSQTITGTLTIPAGGFVLLWADDSPAQGASHLGFKLSATKGDSVSIADQHGNLLDTVSFGASVGQNTYARFPNGSGAFSWCDKPTPGASNGAACGAP